MRYLLPVCVLLCLSVCAASSADFAQIDKISQEDFSWVPRKLQKEPVYKSQNVRYCLWVLGDGKKSIMTMVWDESEGTGKGYDALYVDTNFDGDLTADGKRFFWKNPGKELPKGQEFFEFYEVKNVKEADGNKVFNFTLASRYKSSSFDYGSNYQVAYPGRTYAVGPLPGNLALQWGDSLKSAPIYHLGGVAIPLAGDKLPGETLGTWEVGQSADIGCPVALLGDSVKSQLRFISSSLPAPKSQNTHPQILLRIAGANGAPPEEIPFIGGCG